MDDEHNRRPRRLVLSAENFDDCLVILTTKLHVNAQADRVLAGELLHPLIKFQDDNFDSLRQLRVPFFTPAQILSPPTQSYQSFLRSVTSVLLQVPPPVPVVGGLNVLQVEQDIYR